MLVYAPVDGELELVAVEYLSTDEHAELFGEHFHYTEQIKLYTLHARVWRGNPDGVFNPTNASVECPAH